jgi:hypothetical protein
MGPMAHQRARCIQLEAVTHADASVKAAATLGLMMLKDILELVITWMM